MLLSALQGRKTIERNYTLFRIIYIHVKTNPDQKYLAEAAKVRTSLAVAVG